MLADPHIFYTFISILIDFDINPKSLIFISFHLVYQLSTMHVKNGYQNDITTFNTWIIHKSSIFNLLKLIVKKSDIYFKFHINIKLECQHV